LFPLESNYLKKAISFSYDILTRERTLFSLHLSITIFYSFIMAKTSNIFHEWLWCVLCARPKQ